MIDVDEAVKEFAEKLESGYFSSEREEAHKLAMMYQPDEDYTVHKLDRDTKAVEQYVKSDEFKQLISKL